VMDSANIVRVLQNMINEAEENIEGIAAFKGYEGQVNIAQRRADLAEAVALVEELNKPEAEASGSSWVKCGITAQMFANLLRVYVAFENNCWHWMLTDPRTRPAKGDPFGES